MPVFGFENFILRHTIEFLKVTERFNTLLNAFLLCLYLKLAICIELVASVTCLSHVQCPA